MSTKMNEPSNESLIQALHEAASTLSYYNAAEGDVYRREAGSRAKARARYLDLVEAAIERGVYNKEDFKGYLI